jgi:hypothetical protein
MINNPANSLEFWQKVKAEFEQSTKEIYIYVMDQNLSD